MKECDNSKIHISSNFLLPICLLIMLGTLLPGHDISKADLPLELDPSAHTVKSLDNLYTECPRRNVPYFGRAFLMLNYTEKNPKHLHPKLMVTEIMAREV
jgi:hypothetical protein